MATKTKSPPRARMLKGYAPENFFDEMLAAGSGGMRAHYARFHEQFQKLTLAEFEHKCQSVDLAFLRQGVTFNVYGDAAGAEKIFPFDLLPRIIPAAEWEFLERGLVQRITALNLFLHDLYHEQKILKDGIIPPFYVLSGKHFRREFVNFNVPKDIYIHVCGTDLIRDDKPEEITDAIADGEFTKMQTFSKALIDHVLSGVVDREVAANASTNRHDFMVALEYAEKAKAAGIDHNAPAAAVVAPDEFELEPEPEPELTLRLAPLGD